MKLNEFTMFQKSKPWGYYPPAVEAQIKQYETALSQVNEKYLESCEVIGQLNEKIKRLQDELRDMHLQMSSLELPDVEEVVENYVLNDFKNYNTKEAQKFPEPPIAEEANSVKDIPIEDSGDSNLDFIILQ